MSKNLSPEVQAILRRTREQGGFDPGRYQDIEAAIASSPDLQRYMTDAAKSGFLRQVTYSSGRPGVAGFYDRKESVIHLSPRAWGDSNKKPIQLDVLTGVLGHETGHAIVRRGRAIATERLATDLYNASLDERPDHTEALERYIGHMRRDEALAESFGWNAVHGRVKQEMGGDYNQPAFLMRVAPSTHCVDELLTPTPGLKLSAEGRLDLNEKYPDYQTNVEAMSRCHFDRDVQPEPGLRGMGVDYNYRNYYGAWAIGVMASYRQTLGASDTLRLDMDRLGLDPRQIEQAGLDLGGRGNTLRYENLRGERIVGSGTLSDLGIRTGDQSPREALAQALSAPSEPAGRGLSHTSHPQHALYRALKAELPAETSEDRLTQITAQSHINGVNTHNLWGLVVTKDEVHVLGDVPGMRADISLREAPPSQQESQQQLEAHALQ
ncbi:hypothetical protein EBB59_13190, partial [Lysobacter pythonis]